MVSVLATIRRAATREEMAVATGVKSARLIGALRKLVGERLLAASRRGTERLYYLACSATREQVLTEATRAQQRTVHARLVEHFERRQDRLQPHDDESFVRHLLALGRTKDARERVLGLVTRPASDLSYERRVRLLEDVSARDSSSRARLRLAEEMSRLLGESGDHQKGIALLEPFYQAEAGASTRRAVRIRRLIGVHYHRAGQAERAIEIFEEAQQTANERRDLEQLVFVDSELTELHIFRGSFEEAEAACCRGLARLSRLRSSSPCRGRMEMVLRASLGHLELRRLALDRAREQLMNARALARRHGNTSDRAAILSNLAITENQRNRFEAARECFAEAEDLFAQVGERRSVIKIATNLAVVAAKLGDRKEAHLQVERAAQMARHYPGRRLEFSVAYARGIVHHHFGEIERSVTAFEIALPLGRELGDHYLAGFGEVYLAEAHLAAGQYSEALSQLRATAKQAERDGPPLLVRMVHSRLLVLETVFGRGRSASKSKERLASTARTDVVLLESWNDLFVALSEQLAGRDAGALLCRIRDAFERLGVAAGAGFAELLQTAYEDSAPKPRARSSVFSGPSHVFLSVAVPLIEAEARFARGELSEAERQLAKASTAIVGFPFLELDWRIELLRARVALRHGNLKEARLHLHRSLHTRDHLVQLVPRRLRSSFLRHRRFAVLEKVASRLERTPRLHSTTPDIGRPRVYEGMVGVSAEMLRVFDLIERVSRLELPVMVFGETGTGKELAAHAIHNRSLRSDSPFTALHCAALPSELFEAELFGYKAGAFTEAHEDRTGLLESVDGGTLLLDEVAQLPLACQAKLLRFLDSGMFRRVGDVETRAVDVRLLVASSQDLNDGVRQGTFRQDLYQRLRGAEVRLPALRGRSEDIAALTQFFIERHSERLDRSAPQFDADVVELLHGYTWPGNVRELEGVLLRAFVNLRERERISRDDLVEFLPTSEEAVFDRELLRSRELGDLRETLEAGVPDGAVSERAGRSGGHDAKTEFEAVPTLRLFSQARHRCARVAEAHSALRTACGLTALWRRSL